MPKRKDPSTLEELAIQTLGLHVLRLSRKVKSAVGSGRNLEINVNGLHRFLHADLPCELSRKVAVHMFLVVRMLLGDLRISGRSFDESGDTNVKNFIKNVVLASISPYSIILDMSKLPEYVKRILVDNIRTFKKLQTLTVAPPLPTDFTEALPRGLSLLKFLVNFRMQRCCTDTIINTLGLYSSGTIAQIDVTGSTKVTNVSVKAFMKFHKLKHLSVSDTSMTADGYMQILQGLQQHNLSDDKVKGFLHIGAGSESNWVISSSQLKEISITCPMLKQFDVVELCGDLGTLGSLNELEEVKIRLCDFYMCNLDGFLRVRGCNLTTLVLVNVACTDLICITNHCINLKVLLLWNCTTMDIALGDIENAAKAFQNLEILDLYYVYSPLSIEHVLSICINIRCLLIATDEDITDEFILRLLENNPMKKLTNFTVLSINNLSMKSVNAIIEHCPLLERLEFVDRWKGVTNTEIRTLRQNIKAKNQDLRINLLKE